jgi:serine protease Do
MKRRVDEAVGLTWAWSRGAGLIIGLLIVSPLLSAQEELRRNLPRSLVVAFRDVISEPAKATVQIYCDGERACLGAIIRSDGHIVTKASELKGKIECKIPGEPRRREAKVVARDAATDLAILKVDAHGLPVVPWSTSQALPVGSWLATTGLSQDPISVGVVSVSARRILPPQAALGIQLDSSGDVARIASVARGLPAEKAGLKDGDIIRQVDGEEIKGRTHLQQTIKSRQPGDKVSLVIERDRKPITVEATLGSMTDLVRDERAEFQNALGGELSDRRTGFPMAIQHDSVLRPSECGGPVVGIDGKAVGLNIARAGRVESYALPASVVKETVDKLLATELTSSPAPEDNSRGRKSPTEQER